MDKALLRAAMARNEETQEELAKALSLATSAVSARINGRTDFRASEIQEIIRRYKLTPEETNDIFFNKNAS